jgi:hypothetical protein
MKKAKYIFIFIIFLCILIIAYLSYNLCRIKYAHFLLLDKSKMTLTEYDYKGNVIYHCSIATGKNPGNKRVKGDCKTPEGVFPIQEILDSKEWKHDFKDDSLGEIKGAYGNYFIRLNVKNHKGIGIHGTHDPLSIGKRASEGCIRLTNEDINEIALRMKIGEIVIITPGKEDVDENDKFQKDTVLKKSITKNSISIKNGKP